MTGRHFCLAMICTKELLRRSGLLGVASAVRAAFGGRIFLLNSYKKQEKIVRLL